MNKSISIKQEEGFLKIDLPLIVTMTKDRENFNIRYSKELPPDYVNVFSPFKIGFRNDLTMRYNERQKEDV